MSEENQPVEETAQTPIEDSAPDAAIDATSEDSSPQPAEQTAQADEAEPEWAKKRIDKLTKKRREEERRANEAEGQAEYWRQKALEAQPSSEPAKQAGEPQLENYDDWDTYQKELVAYQVAETLKAEREKLKAEQQAETEKERIARQAQTFQQRAMEFSKEHDDFNDVIANPRLPMNDAMAEAVAISENGPMLAYHLGNNLDEATRIANLPKTQAIREITLLEARLTAQPQPKPTSAPDPITPVDGNTPATDSMENLSIDEWMKRRNKQVNG